MCTCRCPRHLYSSARRLSSLAPRPVFSEWVDGFRWVLLGGLIYTQDRFQIPCLWQSGQYWHHSLGAQHLVQDPTNRSSELCIKHGTMANMDPSMWSYILAPSYGCLEALRIKPPRCLRTSRISIWLFWGGLSISWHNLYIVRFI